MSEFFRQAGDILDTAAGTREPSNAAILIDRSGRIRIVDAAGWSVAGLAAEFGAATIYRIERSPIKVRVEGWNGVQTCLLQRNFHLQPELARNLLAS
jgi:hypothetical protein